VVCKSVQTWARPSEVVRSWGYIFVTAAFCDVDVLRFRVEDWHGLEERSRCICSGLSFRKLLSARQKGWIFRRRF
jgi:hypothetical protein